MTTIRKLITAWATTLIVSLLFPLASVAAVSSMTHDLSAMTTTTPATIAEHTAIVSTAHYGEIGRQSMASGQAGFFLARSHFLNAAKGTAAETRLTTVLGSGRDVARYANRSGFNVLNMDNLPVSEWPRRNSLWLNEAIRRGDNIWLVTDPVKHTQLMQQLGETSYYLDLELPMLQHYKGVNVIPKYITSP